MYGKAKLRHGAAVFIFALFKGNGEIRQTLFSVEGKSIDRKIYICYTP